MDYSEAIAFLCGPYFLQVHPIITQIAKPVVIKSIDDNNDRENKYEYAQRKDQSFWSTANTHWFTIYKHIEPPHPTVIYSHVDDMMYYALPHMHFMQGMPPGYAFLAQTTKDNGLQNRLIVLDLVYPVIEDPIARNSEIRSKAMFFPSTCHVQWVGHTHALKAFLAANKESLPHKVESIMLQSSDPLVVYLYKS
jgi:hypothetical protein